MKPTSDMTTPLGRSGLSKRLAEAEVVARIVERDKGGMYVRGAELAELKAASEKATERRVA